MKKFGIALHGGAGTLEPSQFTPPLLEEYLGTLHKGLQKGKDMLAKGANSLETVVEVVMYLEDTPLFNAGKGSVFSHEGKHEMDASLMCGRTLEAGAVAGVSQVRNPILLAHKVMEHSGHVMLVGKGALDFAQIHDIPLADEEYFYTQLRHYQWQAAKSEDVQVLDHDGNKKFGTVGVVALDRYADVAAGTSTGGLTNKKYGHIGDSAIIGAGTYANNQTCAISCTGYGEYFIRAVVAHDVSSLMQYKGLDLKSASEEVVMHKLHSMGGEGGLIGIDNQGNIHMPFNTKGMYRAAYSSITQQEIVAIF